MTNEREKFGLPWKLVETLGHGKVVDCNGKTVVGFSLDAFDEQTNKRWALLIWYIAKAGDCHHELVDALTELLKEAELVCSATDIDPEPCCEAMNKAKQALKKAGAL